MHQKILHFFENKYTWFWSSSFVERTSLMVPCSNCSLGTLSMYWHSVNWSPLWEYCFYAGTIIYHRKYYYETNCHRDTNFSTIENVWICGTAILIICMVNHTHCHIFLCLQEAPLVKQVNESCLAGVKRVADPKKAVRLLMIGLFSTEELLSSTVKGK